MCEIPSPQHATMCEIPPSPHPTLLFIVPLTILRHGRPAMLFFVSLDPHAIKPHHRIVRGVETDDFVLHGIGFFLAHLKQHGGTQRGVSCGTGGNASFFVLHLLRVLFLFRQPHFFTERRQQLTLRPYFGSHSSFSCVPPPCKTRWYLGGKKRKEEEGGWKEEGGEREQKTKNNNNQWCFLFTNSTTQPTKHTEQYPVVVSLVTKRLVFLRLSHVLVWHATKH